MPYVRSLAFLLITTVAFAEEKEPSFEGTVAATEMRGGLSTTILYTCHGQQVRLEKPDAKQPTPANVFDLKANKLTILYPHNRSFYVVDLAREGKDAPSNFPAGTLSTPAVPPGPQISPPPGFSTPMPMPSIPSFSNNSGAALPNNPGMPAMPNNPGMPSMPSAGMAGGMPMMPPMPMGRMNAPAELKKTTQTKKIQGFDCTLYTLSDPMETMEIWATSDAKLFPFRELLTNYHRRHFGPTMLEETWPALLLKQSLFPLEATMKMQPGGQVSYSFKVDKIDSRKIDNDDLFQPPAGYVEISPPPF
jgi:hypothetical protein